MELTEAYLEEIEKKDGEIGAYITVTAEEALAAAEKFDSEKYTSPLAGIPCALKDNICTKGIRTTCASRMLSDYIPPYDAFSAEKLRAAGAVILGKTNMDEFAMGSTTETSAFRITKNPLDTERVPGGSSGGSAASVAANEAVYSLGSETGGSVRQPAAFCGLVGMKPTYGSVSRYGLIAYASSLDQIGPITKTVADNAAVLNAIVGHDMRDSTSFCRKYGDFTTDIKNGVKGLKIGIPKEFFGIGISEDVKTAVMLAADEYTRLGTELVPVSLPSFEHALSAYYIITCSEASSNLARYDGVRYGHRANEYETMDELYGKSRSEGFGWEVKKRIMLGTMTLSSGFYDAYYKKALKVKNLVINDFMTSFRRCDILLAPTTPTAAYKLGETKDSLRKYTGDICTVPANMAGIPALTLPCGTDAEGMPIGMQLMGPAFSEAVLYRAAYAYENRGKAGM